jgi:hypothetical protein
MPDIGPWLPTLTAIVAALVAGGFAYRANQATIASQRIVELEKRLATSRLETYKPLMEAIAAYFAKGEPSNQEVKRRNDRLLAALSDAALWVPIYGSDETVRVFHRMMQVAFSGAPANIMLRTYGQFMLAIRRDLGDTSTSVDIVDLLGIRINDIYTLGRNLQLSDEAYYRQEGWVPPWPKERNATS